MRTYQKKWETFYEKREDETVFFKTVNVTKDKNGMTVNCNT